MGYDKTQLVIGPMAGLFWDVTVPATGTKLALDSNGHPSDGVLLGYTDRGATLTIGWVTPAEEAWDNQEGYRVVNANQMSIEGTLVQVADLGLLTFLLAPGNLQATDTGTDLVTFGAARKPAQRGALAMVFNRIQSAPMTTPYGYALIYDAFNSATFTFAVTRRDLTRVNFRFDARPVFSRPPTDQYGQFTTTTT